MLLCPPPVSFYGSARFIHHCRNHLYKQDQEYHCNRIYRRIGYTRDIAVYHESAAASPGVLVIPPVMVPSQIEQADLKHQTSDERSNQHRTKVMAAPTPNSSRPLSWKVATRFLPADVPTRQGKDNSPTDEAIGWQVRT